MSKVKPLLDVVKDLRSLADSLRAVADAMTQTESPEPDAAESAEPEVAPDKPHELTMAEVRAAMSARARSGYQAEMRALILKRSVNALSEIDHAEYPALMAEALGYPIKEEPDNG